MNKNMLGIIDATTYKESIEALTVNRSLAAVPFGGRYRLIDFVLSNMVNSGMKSVAIFPRFQYRSLMDHLGSGKQWDLNRKRDGLFFFPTPDVDIQFDLGSFNQFKANIDYFHRSSQSYALITNSNTICNIDYKAVLNRHIEKNCDITEIRHQGKSLEMFILKKSLLLDLIASCEETGYRNIVEVVRHPHNQLVVCDYEYTGYVSVIDSIESYYKHSLELLQPETWSRLFLKSNPILTKVKDEPPTKYMNSSQVKNSMIANGCVIEGKVENSIIFRSVKIGKGTVIKNSIIMQKSQIGDGCELNGVILDKDVKIENHVKLYGTQQKPVVIKKGSVQGALMNS
ncbi:glucose-1-phosphate adenylyltransferase subunit GlgD [Bacillus timonensis]|nr:glucose-1-phosphate adenylyltransferase subunit GlgD [Bacillus timonensis]